MELDESDEDDQNVYTYSLAARLLEGEALSRIRSRRPSQRDPAEHRSSKKARATRPRISSAAWNKQRNNAKLTRTELNDTVMNFLIVEGHQHVAETFAREASVEPDIPLSSIEARTRIREAVQSGNVEEAISLVNDIDPEILESSPDLYFSLQRQRLLELIRSSEIDKALAFAQDELAERVADNERFLDELESVMALLAFPTLEDAPSARLLGDDHRVSIANQLNKAILKSQCQGQNPKLPRMLKTLVYKQRELQKTHKFDIIDPLSSVLGNAHSVSDSEMKEERKDNERKTSDN